jgi:hypothetical protein
MRQEWWYIPSLHCGVPDYGRALWCYEREKVAVITKTVFSLLKNKANNSSLSSESHSIQCYWHWEAGLLTQRMVARLKNKHFLFWETHREHDMRLCLPNYDFYCTDHKDKHRNDTAIAVKENIPHACFDLPPLQVEATEACIPIGNTGMSVAAVYKSLLRHEHHRGSMF